MKDPKMSRRDFLSGMKKWSKVVIATAVVGSAASKAIAASWANRGGGGWANRGGGRGGGWANSSRGGWANRRGGLGWANRY